MRGGADSLEPMGLRVVAMKGAPYERQGVLEAALLPMLYHP